MHNFIWFSDRFRDKLVIEVNLQSSVLIEIKTEVHDKNFILHSYNVYIPSISFHSSILSISTRSTKPTYLRIILQTRAYRLFNDKFKHKICHVSRL